MSWVNKETYENVTWPRYGSVYAWPLNYILNYQKKHQAVKKLNALNWGRKTLQEVINIKTLKNFFSNKIWQLIFPRFTMKLIIAVKL